jgi:hypothetical protein
VGNGRTDQVTSITGLNSGVTSAILSLDYEVETTSGISEPSNFGMKMRTKDSPMTVMLKAATRTVLKLSPNILEAGILRE